MLPVEEVLPQLVAALEARGEAVLVAPPGAGKTTRVAPALLDADWIKGGKIILLSPRRIAARAAAARMAFERGEPVGATIGYRVRLDSKISRDTRIEVVTEGVFTRMILDDPELRGVAAVLMLGVVVGLYEARGAIVSGAVALSNIAQGEFARAGFGIGEINITGQSLTSEADILKALDLAAKTEPMR